MNLPLNDLEEALGPDLALEWLSLQALDQAGADVSQTGHAEKDGNGCEEW